VIVSFVEALILFGSTLVLVEAAAVGKITASSPQGPISVDEWKALLARWSTFTGPNFVPAEPYNAEIWFARNFRARMSVEISVPLLRRLRRRQRRNAPGGKLPSLADRKPLPVPLLPPHEPVLELIDEALKRATLTSRMPPVVIVVKETKPVLGEIPKKASPQRGRPPGDTTGRRAKLFFDMLVEVSEVEVPEDWPTERILDRARDKFKNHRLLAPKEDDRRSFSDAATEAKEMLRRYREAESRKP
jgi:hypothetical protein